MEYSLSFTITVVVNSSENVCDGESIRKHYADEIDTKVGPAVFLYFCQVDHLYRASLDRAIANGGSIRLYVCLSVCLSHSLSTPKLFEISKHVLHHTTERYNSGFLRSNFMIVSLWFTVKSVLKKGTPVESANLTNNPK